jgi:hypothetical protein
MPIKKTAVAGGTHERLKRKWHRAESSTLEKSHESLAVHLGKRNVADPRTHERLKIKWHRAESSTLDKSQESLAVHLGKSRTVFLRLGMHQIWIFPDM